MIKRNANFWTCPACGANLDHGESCDCHKRRLADSLTLMVSYDLSLNDEAVVLVWKKDGLGATLVKEFYGEEALDLYNKLTQPKPQTMFEKLFTIEEQELTWTGLNRQVFVDRFGRENVGMDDERLMVKPHGRWLSLAKGDKLRFSEPKVKIREFDGVCFDTVSKENQIEC